MFWSRKLKNQFQYIYRYSDKEGRRNIINLILIKQFKKIIFIYRTQK